MAKLIGAGKIKPNDIRFGFNWQYNGLILKVWLRGDWWPRVSIRRITADTVGKLEDYYDER